MSTSPATPAATTPAPARRRSRWLMVPAVLLGLIVLVVIILYVRGSWAGGTLAVPVPGQGPVSQLCRSAEGQLTVHSALVLPYPRRQVWTVVTDYENYSSFLPYLDQIQATRNPDESIHMEGLAKSALWGYWPFTIDIHEDRSGEAWTSNWDQEGQAGEVVRLNQGGWALTELEADQTLLELHLETEVKGYPTFFLRNYYLSRLPHVLQAVEHQLRERFGQN
jgi:hypothetical protein